MAREHRIEVLPTAAWVDELQRGERGTLLATLANVVAILTNDPRWQDVLAYDALGHRVVKRKAPPYIHGGAGEWEDIDGVRARIWLSERYQINPSRDNTNDAILAVACANTFHPLRDYLDSLTWDGRQRLDMWLFVYLGASDEQASSEDSDRLAAYLQAAGRMWMIGAVARVMQSPCKMDCMLILEGLQGKLKSTALAVLGGDWFSDSALDLSSKEASIAIQGVWIHEMAELESLNKHESSRIKQFLSWQTDRFRRVFGTSAQTFPRQTVFSGTTNQESYLRDSTGARRFWPVRVGRIDIEALKRDRDQLWAEAVARYREGESWWPDATEIALPSGLRVRVSDLFTIQQEERFSEDAWEDLIEQWLLEAGQIGRLHFSLAEILDGALGLQAHQMRPPESQRVGAIMQRIGWRKVRRQTGSGAQRRRQWAYERPCKEKL